MNDDDGSPLFLKGPPDATLEEMVALNPASKRQIGRHLLHAAGFTAAEISENEEALLLAAIAGASSLEGRPPASSAQEGAQLLRKAIEAELAKGQGFNKH